MKWAGSVTQQVKRCEIEIGMNTGLPDSWSGGWTLTDKLNRLAMISRAALLESKETQRIEGDKGLWVKNKQHGRIADIVERCVRRRITMLDIEN
uniref:HA domain-containing protein n=1 Tax=Heterorhabditis bacteriophora TaxID=37862 RepID=A0A1I7WZ11_HETBA